MTKGNASKRTAPKKETGEENYFSIQGNTFLAIDAISGQRLEKGSLAEAKYPNFIGKKIQIIGVAENTRINNVWFRTTRDTFRETTSVAFHIEGESNTGEAWAVLAENLAEYNALQKKIMRHLPRE